MWRHLVCFLAVIFSPPLVTTGAEISHTGPINPYELITVEPTTAGNTIKLYIFSCDAGVNAKRVQTKTGGYAFTLPPGTYNVFGEELDPAAPLLGQSFQATIVVGRPTPGPTPGPVPPGPGPEPVPVPTPVPNAWNIGQQSYTEAVKTSDAAAALLISSIFQRASDGLRQTLNSRALTADDIIKMQAWIKEQLTGVMKADNRLARWTTWGRITTDAIRVQEPKLSVDYSQYIGLYQEVGQSLSIASVAIEKSRTFSRR